MAARRVYDIVLSEDVLSMFSVRKNSLLDYVNRHMMEHPDIEKIIGGRNNFQVMLDNHRNHLSFIEIVLRLRNAEILMNTLPWVYSSYHNQGFSFDYFRMELELWKDAVEKNLSDIDCTPVTDPVRYNDRGA